MSINKEFYTLPEPEEPVEAEIIYQDVPAFSSPLETEREWPEPFVAPMPPEFIQFEAQPELQFETPSVTLPTEEPKTETKYTTEYKTEIIERFTEIPVETVRNIGFFAVLLALLFGVPIDTYEEEMV